MAKRTSKKSGALTYSGSGVDISANDEMVDRIKKVVRRTYDPRVLSRHGAFAGLMRLDFAERLLRRRYRDPVLVAGADGVGSKVLLGIEWKRVADLGIDLVAMCVNDVLTIGAEPLFFLDYVACHKLEPDRIVEIVEGVSEGCRQAGCALLGGETAEMPSMYARTHFDLAGFCTGVVEQRKILDRSNVRPGDVVIGLASNGIHSNGFSLVRKALKRLGKKRKPPIDLGEPLVDAVMRPTRIYVRPVHAVMAHYRRKQVIRAMAHITGGGIDDNVTRVLPTRCAAHLYREAWPVPPVFRLIQSLGVDESEMFNVFNMGIGYTLIVRPTFADSIVRQFEKLGERAYRIGIIRRGKRGVVWK